MWQKIETFDFPKEPYESSRNVLLYNKGVYIGHYVKLDTYGRWETEEYWTLNPTHWMELPEKPEDV